MQNMQYASMLGTQSPQVQAENLTGGFANRASAIAGPAAMGGLALAGLDPLSLGARTAWGLRGAGMLTAGAAGLGVGAVAGAGLMAAGYVGGQFMQGAQQQQQLHQVLRNTFQVPNQYGGAGFSRAGMSEIGSTFRQMTTEQGPMGQMVGFEELGRLASNMGRMGMAQGVRDAHDFSDKFKQMVRSLKEIATEMGTSLEEAQKMMGAMRSSGVFGAGKAAQFAHMIRGGAHAGGLATSELTGMMNIGSQISRSVGGRGVAGAQAGIETLTNIGVAQQLGVLSEEDIYNATGLTGAEGRRAMATQQLSNTAQFLKGGLGRRFLAAIAGGRGSLDQGSVDEFMAGGVGTGRTMQMAHRNLAKIGRADFIRNEGRLRGEAMKQFGGLAPAMVLRGWLQQRGIDINEDNDRAMIFTQRRLGMGTDEAEMMVRMARQLPSLMREREVAGREDQFMRAAQQREAGHGLSGLKRKFEKARADVQAGLQEAGATWFSEVSEDVERFVNKLTGDSLQVYRRDVARALQESRQGGAIGRGAFQRVAGRGIVSEGMFSRASSGLNLGFGGGGGGLSSADIESLQSSGNLRQVAGKSGAELQTALQSLDAMSAAFESGGAGLQGRGAVVEAGRQNRDLIRSLFTSGSVRGRGAERMGSISAQLRSRLEAQIRAGGGGDDLFRRLNRAGSSEEEAQILAAAMSGAGVEGEGEMFQRAGDLTGLFSKSRFSTEGERDEAIGAALFGKQADTGGTLTRSAMVAASPLMMGIPGGAQAAVGLNTLAVNRSGPSRQRTMAAGEFFSSERGRRLLAESLSENAGLRNTAKDSMEKELMALQRKEHLSNAEQGRRDALRSMLLGQAKAEAAAGGLSGEEAQRALEDRAKTLGVDPHDADRMADVALAVRKGDIDQARQQDRAESMREASDRIISLTQSGLVQRGLKGDLTLTAGAGKGLSGGAHAFMNAMLAREQAQASGGIASDEFQTATDMFRIRLEGLSVEDKRAVASQMRGALTPEARGMLGRQAGIQEMLQKAGGGFGGRLGRLAGTLGVGLDRTALAKMAKGSTEDIANQLASAAGLEGDAVTELKAAVGGLREKGGLGTSAGAIDRLMPAVLEAQRKQNLANREQNDPLAAETRDHAKTTADNTKEMLTQLRLIAGNTQQTDSSSAEDTEG